MPRHPPGVTFPKSPHSHEPVPTPPRGRPVVRRAHPPRSCPARRLPRAARRTLVIIAAEGAAARVHAYVRARATSSRCRTLQPGHRRRRLSAGNTGARGAFFLETHFRLRWRRSDKAWLVARSIRAQQASESSLGFRIFGRCLLFVYVRTDGGVGLNQNPILCRFVVSVHLTLRHT